MALIGDRDSTKSFRDPRVHQPSPDRPGMSTVLEQQFVEHRAAVLAMLRVEFPRLPEPEDIFQEACTELLEKQIAAGEQIPHLRALLKRIAWRRARDYYRNRKPDYFDPTSPVLASAADAAASPDEVAQVHIDAAMLRFVLDEIDERQAAVIKYRYDLGLSHAEICERIGISRGALEKVFTSAYKAIFALVQPDAGNESKWERRQRSLLQACEAGIASERQREKALEMLEQDPRCRAILAEMRETLRGIAVALPLPVIESAAQRNGRRLEVATGWFEHLRLTGRAAANEATTRLPLGTAAEAATTGGTALTAGAAAKVIAACIAMGGTAAVCTTAIVGRFDEPKPAPKPPVAAAKVLEPPRTAVAVVRTPPPKPKPAPAKKRRKRTPASRNTAQASAPVSSPRYQTPATPAPVGSTEFGPGALGSSSAPSAPAPAPADGGGEFLP